MQVYFICEITHNNHNALPFYKAAKILIASASVSQRVRETKRERERKSGKRAPVSEEHKITAAAAITK